MVQITNAFSLNMLTLVDGPVTVEVTPVAPADIPADAESAIGHADTARLVGGLLGRELAANRATIKLAAGDVVYIAQYIGPRLPEGATSLPEGARIDFVRVDVR